MIYAKTDELYHHGIKGQKWGIRRYQNPDGTLTEAGRKRYGSSVEKVRKKDLLRQTTNFYMSHPNAKSSKYVDKKGEEAWEYADKTQAAKEFWELNDAILEASARGERMGSPVYFGKQIVDELNRRKEAYEKEARNYLNRPDIVDEYASLMLDDLGYENTASGRAYISEVLSYVSTDSKKL
jgi:hypothetical protein